ncbi:hypothetical protein BDV38DRAFT_259232 [Aspergillus pseudotamarii]|uniref:Uncharacterized protein n=1 Tax=Aspergillus pseudotamarii TaxID=132259 RepID=A0A5N6SHA0_ASPPS|nr:uncharacterized protein BDV38DRAFT_259232 [Aspergillus pseudotamarii]KAE8133110.1 hypothetical protein BDV38DRAFT_259232 [Aspergillus pseudotamarii]
MITSIVYTLAHHPFTLLLPYPCFVIHWMYKGTAVPSLHAWRDAKEGGKGAREEEGIF